jgi:hypothetical protein
MVILDRSHLRQLNTTFELFTNSDYIFRHPEAGTTILSAYTKIRTGKYNGAVVLDCQDTDEYVHAASLTTTPC